MCVGGGGGGVVHLSHHHTDKSYLLAFRNLMSERYSEQGYHAPFHNTGLYPIYLMTKLICPQAYFPMENCHLWKIAMNITKLLKSWPIFWLLLVNSFSFLGQ